MNEEILIPIPEGKLIEFITGGNSEIVVENTNTGNHRVYRFKVVPGWDNAWYAYSGKSYLGRIDYDGTYIFKTNTDYLKATKEFTKVFQLITTNRLPAHAKVYHTGRCYMCHRRLTDPESIRLGIGPECRGKR